MADEAAPDQGSNGGTPSDGGAPPADNVLGADAAAAPKSDAAPADAPKSDAAPADVNYEFKFADGLAVDAKLTDEMKAWAKESGLKPEAAQKAADFASKLFEQNAEKYVQEIVDLRNSWAEQVRADKELGGDKMQEVLAGANKALADFGSAELVKVLKDTGLSNHPEVVRLFHNIHKTISQDSVAAAITAASSAGKTREQKYYGSQS